MRYEGTKIVYEVGDWVTRTKETHLGMYSGDTDRVVGLLYSDTAVVLQKFVLDGNDGGSHESKNFHPATQEEINKATKEEKIMVGEFEVHFYQHILEIGCARIPKELFQKIGKKAGWL